MNYNENQKIKEVIKAAKRDPDAASAFYFGDGIHTKGAIIVIKPKSEADIVIKWLLDQGLTTDNPIPPEGTANVLADKETEADAKS